MNDKDITYTDDGWWEAVLADESLQAPAAPETLSQDQPGIETNPPVDIWEKVKKLYDQDEIITLKVTGYNRGGVLVGGDEIKGFVPSSHLVREDGLSRLAASEEILASYQGKTLRLKIIECIPEKERIVFSERAAQAGAGRRRELFNTLETGKIVSGEITNITDFGAFIDLGGVEGLIHISELSWGRVGHPSEIVEIGKKYQAQVLDISPKQCRVALSLKRLMDNPWDKITEKYHIGDIVPATLTAFVSFGVFARLDDGIEGLIHRSEMPFSQNNLHKGDRVHVKILEIQPKKQRMGLSLRFNQVNDQR